MPLRVLVPAVQTGPAVTLLGDARPPVRLEECRGNRRETRMFDSSSLYST